jgi:hypothetical protein
MNPTLVVWTNARADHEEVWGPGAERAFAFSSEAFRRMCPWHVAKNLPQMLPGSRR